MMAESIYFDIGSFPPASLRLVSGNGLVPLTLPVPLNGSAERFRQLMESDVRQTVASIRSAVEMPDVTRPAAEGRVVVEDVAVARPHNTVIVDVPPQAADDVATPSLPSVVPVTAESQPAVESRPVVESSPIVESKPVVEVPVAEKRLVADDPVTELRIVEPTVSETPVSKPKMSTKRGPVDAPLHAAPVSVSVAPATPMAVAQPDIVKQANAATARIEVVVETVEQIVETVVDRIFATPSLAQGEGEIRIMLRPTVLDGSELSISAKDGTLTVSVAPATPEAARVVAFALPRLETALVEHAPAFHHVAVVLATVKKGKNNEAA